MINLSKLEFAKDPLGSGSGIWSKSFKNFRVIIWIRSNGIFKSEYYTEINIKEDNFGDNSIWIKGQIKINSEKDCWHIIINQNKMQKVINLIDKNAFEKGKIAKQIELKDILGL